MTGFVISNLNENLDSIELVSLDAKDNMKYLAGKNPWKAEKEKYQKENGGDFRMALLSTQTTRPIT